MLIETNIEVNLRSIEEFTRVMVSELLEDKINFEILKDVVSFAVAVFVKFQNFKISAKFDLADLIAGAAVRVKLRCG